MRVPCKNCTLRQVGCHGDCEGYEAYQKRCEERRQAKWNYDRMRDVIFTANSRRRAELAYQSKRKRV